LSSLKSLYNILLYKTSHLIKMVKIGKSSQLRLILTLIEKKWHEIFDLRNILSNHSNVIFLKNVEFKENLSIDLWKILKYIWRMLLRKATLLAKTVKIIDNLYIKLILTLFSCRFSGAGNYISMTIVSVLPVQSGRFGRLHSNVP